MAVVLEAMREPGFRAVCADATLSDDAGLLFLEFSLAALKTVAKLLPMTADRPPQQRFKPLVARARAVATSDVHVVRGDNLHCALAPVAGLDPLSGGRHFLLASTPRCLGPDAGFTSAPSLQALGVKAGSPEAGKVASMVQTTPRSTGFVALLSVSLSADTAVAFPAKFAGSSGDAPVELLRSPALSGAPSIWAEVKQAVGPKVRVSIWTLALLHSDAQHPLPPSPPRMALCSLAPSRNARPRSGCSAHTKAKAALRSGPSSSGPASCGPAP